MGQPEMVQHRVARFVTIRLQNTSSFGDMFGAVLKTGVKMPITNEYVVIA